jgi:transposase InsO family protein
LYFVVAKHIIQISYAILGASNQMLRLKKLKVCTRDSTHSYPRYPTQLRGFVQQEINQLWVCDITYICTHACFCFLSLITDGYLHKIAGWVLAQSLSFHYTQEVLW